MEAKDVRTESRLWETKAHAGIEWQALDAAAGRVHRRSFAHMYETGAMRRTHLRGRDNIRKRLLIYASAFNLSLGFGILFKVGTPRRLQGRKDSIFSAICAMSATLTAIANNLSNSRTLQSVLHNDKYFAKSEPVLLAARVGALKMSTLATVC